MMPDANDNEWVREFAREKSETAFAALVRQHVHLVFATALRQIGDRAAAEEITQTVFVALAQSAGKLGSHPTIAGWLHQTALNKSREWLRGELRRRRREQTAVELAEAKAEGDSVWTPLVPLLDEALLQLRDADRAAVILHFMEGRTFQEVGAALGVGEDTARKRVDRCLEQLTKFFQRQGFTIPTLSATAPLFALATHTAPTNLAASATSAGLAAHSASVSTLTLKGALKIMAWTKTKTAVVAGFAAAAIIGTTTSTIVLLERNPNQQRLKDGSLLSVIGISFGATHDVVINGKKTHWSWPGHDELSVEFKLSGKNAANNPLVKPPFYRPVRAMLHGDSGIEFAQEVSPDGFKKVGRDYYGEIDTEIVPRDSRYLWLRIEESPTNNPYGSWQTIANFKFQNPAHAINSNWTDNATPTTNVVDGMNFVLRAVTLKTNADDERDIWNHKVTIATEVWTNGIPLTNWSPVYITAADTSGNHVSNFQSHRSIDPRYVWKLDMDFEIASNFPTEDVVTVPLRRTTLTTNVMGMPVTISWNGQWIDANMPTNYSGVGIKFINVTDRQGNIGTEGSASWSQHSFRAGGFYSVKNGVYNEMGPPVTLTFAVVPNVHTTFYVQPQLLTE